MTAPTPEVFGTGDVKREPQGRAVAIRGKGGLAGLWSLVSIDQGIRLASSWEADVIEAWPNMVPDDATPAT